MIQQPTGSTIGKYEIRAELGRGAMGVVYVAHDPVLDRRVALKVMAANILEDPDLKERFRREAQAVAKLQSPNIVTVYDFGYHQDAPYIAMEMLSGTDLEAKLRSPKPPPLAQKIEFVRQVCHGLSHAHDQGIVHRDIKPANIFVTDTGLVKIMDFGTARLAQSTQTQTGTVMGTVAYMSPEQIQGQKVDGRSDIFSLGVLLYRLLCHQQPFGGENIHHIIYKILNVQPAHLVLPEGVQVPSLQHIVDRALSKDLSQRYQSADDMARDLTAFQNSQSASIAEDTIFRTMSLDEESEAPQIGGPTQAVGGVTQPVPSSTTDPTVFLEGETIKTDQLVVPKEGPPKPRSEVAVASAASKKSTLPWLAAVVLLAAVAFAVGYTFFSKSSPDAPPQIADTGPAETPPAAVADQATVVPEGAGTADASTTGTQPSPSGTDGGTVTAGADREDREGTPSRPADAAPPPPTAPRQAPPPRQTSPPPPTVDRTAQKTQSTLEEIRAALASGQLTQAQDLIESGRRLDANNGIWDLLENERLVADNNLRGNTLLNQGLDLFSKGQLDAAITAYDQALAAFGVAATLAPGHTATQQGKLNAANFKTQAITAKRQLQTVAAPASSRQFTDSETSFKASGKKTSGFVDDDKISVQEATRTTSIPGELLIELVPRNVEIGAPYLIKVRLRNKSNSALFAKSLLLVSTFKDKRIGAGQPIDLSLRRVDAQSTAVLFETRDVWSEALDQGGKIEATVTLANVGDLLKTLEWSAP